MSEHEKKAREISIDVLRHLKWCPETPESQNHAIAQIQPTIFAAIEEAVAAEQMRAARIAYDHAEFCRKEAHAGGSHDLYERASGANHIGRQIMVCKP